MAALIRPATVVAVLAALALAGCDALSGFGGDVPPLATIPVEVTGDLGPLRPPGTENETPALAVALVWGEQWQTEPLCILPPGSPEIGAAVAAGCRDPFGFVPTLVAANTPVEPGVPTQLDLLGLPSADVMVGTLISRVAYGSLVVYDDRDGNGTLDLRRFHETPHGGEDRGDGEGPPAEGRDVVYGASFISMTLEDRRIAFREGAFNAASAFYPRPGCGEPPAGFSVVGAGGFSAEDAIAASLMGMLPLEDPTTCVETAVDASTISIPLQDPASVSELACSERVRNPLAMFREPPADAPDFTNRTLACGPLPDFGTGLGAGIIELVVTGRPDDQCVGITHYALRGCRENVLCEVPDWDFTATPPAWWPCLPPAAVAP